MPTMIKPRTLGVLTKVERRGTGASFIVTAFGLFDLARPEADRFETDQTMWMMAAKALPKGSVLDIGMPKPRAEMLVGGTAAAPGGTPVPAMMLEWRVGPLHKRLAILGDRYWQIGGGGVTQTEPKPFAEMPIDPERAFGGPGHPDNPSGIGFKAQERIQARQPAPLPNIEYADHMIRSIDQTPPPALCGPMDLASPKRRRYAGTYDDHWLKTNAPSLPDDVDPRLFLLAAEDQQFPDFLSGGEPYALRGFCKDHEELRGTLPAFRVRAFLARRPGQDDAPPGEFSEMSMRIDTLWLVAGARRGILVYRGALPVTDVDAEDLSHVMLAYERAGDAPRPFEHYHDVRQLRADRRQAFKYAFSEGQLAPPLSPENVARRNAERQALQQTRLDDHAAGQRWMIERQLRQSGVPEALWPAIPTVQPDSDLAAFPMPTPEELQDGDVDLAALLDAAEALQNNVAAKIDETRAQAAPMLEAMAGLKAPDAGPDSVDALFAALDGLGAANPAGRIDQAVGGLRIPDFPVEADPKIVAEATAKIDGVKDWRRLLLDAAQGPIIDEEAEFRSAHGRFLDLPEFRPMADIRKALGEAKTDLPNLPNIEWPPEVAARDAAPASESFDVLALLDGLDRESNVPKSTVADIRGQLDDADAKLRSILPNLPERKSAIAALLEAVSPPPSGEPQPPDPQAALSSALATRDRTLSEATEKLAEQEAKIMASLAQMRRALPVASYPQRPLIKTVARRFGDAILAAHRSGLSLRGRDMAGADLRGADLRGADLEGALLEQADLSGACLAGSRLVDVALTAAVLDETDLSDADLSGANLAKVKGRATDFSRSIWARSVVLDADLREARLNGATWRGIRVLTGAFEAAEFQGATLEQCVFMKSGFDRSTWDGASVDRTQFVETSMAQVSFKGARLHRCAFLRLIAPNADFAAAELSRCAFLGEADLTSANFDDAIAHNAGFTKANLSGASFVRSRFDSSNFGEADLNGANLRLASLKGSLFGAANLGGADFVGANLFRAQMRRADLSGAQLRGANLYGSMLNDAELAGADFSGANLAKTMLEVDTNAG